MTNDQPQRAQSVWDLIEDLAAEGNKAAKAKQTDRVKSATGGSGVASALPGDWLAQIEKSLDAAEALLAQSAANEASAADATLAAVKARRLQTAIKTDEGLRQRVTQLTAEAKQTRKLASDKPKFNQEALAQLREDLGQLAALAQRAVEREVPQAKPAAPVPAAAKAAAKRAKRTSRKRRT